MTLFRKIFDSHAEAIGKAGQSAAVAPPEAEDLANLREVFVLPPEMRGLLDEDETADQGEDLAEAPGEDMPEALDDDDWPLGDDEPENPAPEPAPAPTLAERAAEAQRQMQETQARMSFQTEPPAPAPASAEVTPLPQATEGRAGRRAGRVKTRLLGFDGADGLDVADPLQAAAPARQAAFPVGWFVVVKGPGRGQAFALYSGVSLIGRGEDQGIRLDFGDTSISRQNHAAIAYDDEQNSFFLGHGGKSNIIRLNNRPVLSTEEIANGDLVRIGETTLRLVALCGPEFTWGKDGSDDA